MSAGPLRAHLALMGASTIWGLSYLFTKLQLEDLGPFQAATARVVLSALLLAPAIRHLPRSGIGPRTGIVLGFLGITAYYTGFNLGLATARATDAGVIQASIPAVSAVLAIPLLRERPRRRVWAGIALSFIGVVALVSGTSAAGEGSIVGDLWIVFSVVVWALYSILVRRLGPATSATAVTAATLMWGGILLLPLALAELLTVTPHVTAQAVGATVYLAIFAGTIGYLLWSFGLARVPAAQATTYLNVLPVIAAVSGALVLGETIGLTELLSGGVIVAGVYILKRTATKFEPPMSTTARKTSSTVEEGRGTWPARIGHGPLR